MLESEVQRHSKKLVIGNIFREKKLLGSCKDELNGFSKKGPVECHLLRATSLSSSSSSSSSSSLSSSSSSCLSLSAEKPFQGKPSGWDLGPLLTQAQLLHLLLTHQLPNAKVTTRAIVKKVWGARVLPRFARIFSRPPPGSRFSRSGPGSRLHNAAKYLTFTHQVLSLTITRTILEVWL